MRITTQMLNDTAKRAGLPIHNTSLLNYINQGESGNSLLSSLNKKNRTSSLQNAAYEKLKRNGQALEKSAKTLASESDSSVFAKAKENGEKGELYKQASQLISNYNATVKALASTASPLNNYYKKMLQAASSDNKELLEKAGISIGKEGMLTINSKKFQEADMDTLEKALGNSSDFSQKVAFIGGRIADNAKAGIDSVNSQYSINGAAYSNYSSNQYNWWG
ncbi:MAG: hypothetical protein K2M46_03855 [Lachnospiraceae bacterium]|nr:hypothetical protein [Lachnospiraceae bacterium]